MARKRTLCMVASICLILIFPFLPFMTSYGKAAPPEGNILHIGYLAGFTGFGSQFLQMNWEGVQLAEQWINEHGGFKVDGKQYQIKLHGEDTKSTAEGSVSAANKLVYDQGLKFIGGPTLPWVVAASGTVTEPAGVIRSVGYNCSLPTEFSAKTPNTFVAYTSSVSLNRAAMQYLSTAYPEVKTVVILIPDDGAIPYLGPQCIKNAQECGLTVLGDIIGWALDTVDFTPIVVKATVNKPDAVCLQNGFPSMCGAFLKIAREMGYKGTIFAPSNDSCTDVREVAGRAASDNFFSTSLYLDSPGMTPMIKEITKMSKARFHHAFPFHFQGFQPIWTMVQAIEGAQSFDPTEVRDYWAGMDNIDTVTGPGKMGGLKTFGINHHLNFPAPISTLTKGEVRHIKFEPISIP